MRADARKNYDHILTVARDLLTRKSTDASLRDIARQAGVGDGTLHRHFPNREALLEALLRERFAASAQRADDLATSDDVRGALVTWLREAIAMTHNYSGVIAPMVAAIADEKSALHSTCVSLRTAGARLLARAQSEGVARQDMDGDDLFALISALAWLAEQPPLAPRSKHLFDIISDTVLCRCPVSPPKES